MVKRSIRSHRRPSKKRTVSKGGNDNHTNNKVKIDQVLNMLSGIRIGIANNKETWAKNTAIAIDEFVEHMRFIYPLDDIKNLISQVDDESFTGSTNSKKEIMRHKNNIDYYENNLIEDKNSKIEGLNKNISDLQQKYNSQANSLHNCLLFNKQLLKESLEENESPKSKGFFARFKS